MKRICGSTKRPSDDRSSKTCACGGHSHGSKKSKKKDRFADTEALLVTLPDTGFTHGAGSNEDAEFVAAHPETWTPITKGKP